MRIADTSRAMCPKVTGHDQNKSERYSNRDLELTPANPLLLGIQEARRQLGGIGNTAFYDAVKRHSIKLVKIGSRSLVPMSEIERVVAELVTAANDRAEAQAKAVELAKKSVAARRTRRLR